MLDMLVCSQSEASESFVHWKKVFFQQQHEKRLGSVSFKNIPSSLSSPSSLLFSTFKLTLLKSHDDSTHSLPLSSLCWWQLGRHCLPRLARPAAAWLDEAACLATPARAQQLTQTRAQPQQRCCLPERENQMEKLEN